jgi:hypothetical protein
LKKWAFAFAAAALVVIGCGGGGGGSNSTGTGGTATTGTPGESTAVVSLPSDTGLINVTYLTGAGRAFGSPIAVIHRVQLTDSSGVIETILNPDRNLQLDAYTAQIISLSVPTLNSRLFETFNLEIKSLLIEQDPGVPPQEFSGNNGPLVQASFPAYIRAFPGRQTAVTIRLDDTMLNLDEGGAPFFNQAVFEAANLNPDTGTINGFLSDYVMFDISGMSIPERPDFTSGGSADRVYFSGDQIAISKLDPLNSGHGAFSVLTPIGFVDGAYGPPTSIAPFGTYTLVQPDPRDLTGLNKITALQGIWRNLTDVVTGVGTFEVITFPNSKDDNKQDIVLVHRGGNGKIDELYFGEADLDAGTLQAFPIGQVDDGDASNDIAGTLTDLKDKNGNLTTDPSRVRSGHYTLTPGGGAVPASFSTSGRFIVFRR